MEKNQNLGFYPEEMSFDRETGKFSKIEQKENGTKTPLNLSNPLLQNFLSGNSLIKNMLNKNMSKEEFLMQALSSTLKNESSHTSVVKTGQNSDFFEEL